MASFGPPAQGVPETDPIPGLSCCLNQYISFYKSPLLLNFLLHASKRVLSVTLFNQFIYCPMWLGVNDSSSWACFLRRFKWSKICSPGYSTNVNFLYSIALCSKSLGFEAEHLGSDPNPVICLLAVSLGKWLILSVPSLFHKNGIIASVSVS